MNERNYSGDAIVTLTALIAMTAVLVDEDAGTMAGRAFQDRLRQTFEAMIDHSDRPDPEQFEVALLVGHLRDQIEHYIRILPTIDSTEDFWT